MADFKKLMNNMKEYPEIHPEVIRQKSIFCSGLTFAYHANEMNENEVLDTDFLNPSYRHFGTKACYSRHLVAQLYKYRDNYEKIVTIIFEAIFRDMSQHSRVNREYNKFIRSLWNFDYSDWMLNCLNNQYSEYLGSIRSRETGSAILDKVYASYTYKDLAESLYELISYIFDNYQFIITEEAPESEKSSLMTFSEKCREYRWASSYIGRTEGLTEIYPCSSKEFTGTMKINCDRHGDYEAEISINGYSTECRCPVCLDEERRARLGKEAEDFIAKAKEKYGDFYDYSLVAEDFESFKKGTVRIIHPELGIFWIVPATHLKSPTGYNGRKKAAFPNTVMG